MKKYIALFLVLLCAFALAGCSKEEPEVKWARIPMVMVDGVLYLDTGFTNYDVDDGAEPDGEITSQVDSSEEPTENDQSNFGTGYKYRYGETEGTIDVYLNGKWRIFATEEARHKLQFPENDEEDLSEIPGAVLHVVDIWDRAEEERLPCAEALELFYEDETNEYYFSLERTKIN